jgi:hypothetical protein
VYWSDRVRRRTRRIGYKFKPFVTTGTALGCDKIEQWHFNWQQTELRRPTPNTKLRSGHALDWGDVVRALTASTNFFCINRHLLNFSNSMYNHYTGVFRDRTAPLEKKRRVCARGLLNCAHWGVKHVAVHSIRKVNTPCLPAESVPSSSGCYTKGTLFHTNLNILHPRPCIMLAKSQKSPISIQHGSRKHM